MYKMYCIVRNDLRHNHKACQGGHAIAQYFIDHGKHEFWNNGTMIYLRAKDEAHLIQLKDKLKKDGIKHSYFVEPDIGNQFTAIACIDNEKEERFKNLRLL